MNAILIFFMILIGFAAIPAAIAFITIKLTEAETSRPDQTTEAQTPEPSSIAPEESATIEQGSTVASNLPDSYTPNQIPRTTRIWNISLSLAMIIYGTIGLLINDLYIPGKRSNGVHLHGLSAWVMYSAILFAVLNLLAVVVDHYDQRNNERHYLAFTKFTQYIGWTLFFAALVLGIARNEMN